MLTLAELTSRFPRPGRVEQILVRPHRKGDLHHLDAAQLLQDGIDGDHARPGKRAVSLIQSEHLPVLRALSVRAGAPRHASTGRSSCSVSSVSVSM